MDMTPAKGNNDGSAKRDARDYVHQSRIKHASVAGDQEADEVDAANPMQPSSASDLRQWR